MPFRGPTPAEIDAVIDTFLPLIAGHPNDPLADAPNLTFAQIETASAAFAQQLMTRLAQSALDRHSATVPAEAACPRCRLRAALTKKKRRVKTPSGTVEYAEPAGHCTDCRCDFFPGARSLEVG